jgi:hypothetical protein
MDCRASLDSFSRSFVDVEFIWMPAAVDTPSVTEALPYGFRFAEPKLAVSSWVRVFLHLWPVTELAKLHPRAGAR